MTLGKGCCSAGHIVLPLAATWASGMRPMRRSGKPARVDAEMPALPSIWASCAVCPRPTSLGPAHHPHATFTRLAPRRVARSVCDGVRHASWLPAEGKEPLPDGPFGLLRISSDQSLLLSLCPRVPARLQRAPLYPAAGKRGRGIRRQTGAAPRPPVPALAWQWGHKASALLRPLSASSKPVWLSQSRRVILARKTPAGNRERSFHTPHTHELTDLEGSGGQLP